MWPSPLTSTIHLALFKIERMVSGCLEAPAKVLSVAWRMQGTQYVIQAVLVDLKQAKREKGNVETRLVLGHC